MTTTLTTPRRLAVGVAAAVLAGTGLTGCGGDSSEDFCALADDVQSSDLGADANMDDVREALDEAVDAAPDDIKGDVETIRDALDDFDPENMDLENMDEDAMAEMEETSKRVEEAGANIEAYVNDNC